MAAEMDQRKKQILKVITDDYIISAEPVGSRTIARKHNLGLSPATIRNEMADLEESGYLEQPHTSAGRVPSEQGYRYYVDALMSLQKLSPQEMDLIYHDLEQHRQGIEAVIHQTSKLLVQMTRYPALVLSPHTEAAVFRHLQLVRLTEQTVLVLVVTDTGFVENKVIELQVPLSDRELDRISNLLNQRLRGLNLKDLRSAVVKEIRAELVIHEEFLNEALKLLLQAISNHSQERVVIDGAAKILEQPEFADVQRIKPIMRVLEEEQRLYKMLTATTKSGSQVKIGRENQEAGIAECSVVTANYQIAGQIVGVIGVLGPTRMEYGRVMPIVEYTAAILSELLTKLSRSGSGK